METVCWLAVLLSVSANAADAVYPDQWTRDLAIPWRFRPDPNDVGLKEGWHTEIHSDADWPMIEAGIRWEDQGYPDLDGTAWYRMPVQIPQNWAGRAVWLILGGVSDSCAVFCNGQYVASYGDEKHNTVHRVFIIAHLSPHLRFGDTNLLAIRCFDWGATGGLWRPPCLITCDARNLPMDSLFSCLPDTANASLNIDADIEGLGNDRPDVSVAAQVFLRGRRVGAHTEPIPRGASGASFAVAVAEPKPGAMYEISLRIDDAEGNLFEGIRGAMNVNWPEPNEWAGKYKRLKVLNNFVTELHASQVRPGAVRRRSFLNPREGWVFIALSDHDSRDADTAPTAFLDENPAPVAWRVNPDTGALEAMQWLNEGAHRLRVRTPAPVRLDIRAVPEIAYCYYPTTPHIRPFGPYDWTFLSRHVLPHVNAIVTGGGMGEQEFGEWVREGRKWIGNAPLPGLSDAAPPAADDVYEIWASNPGTCAPGYSGIMVDEFLTSSAAHYRAWTEAMERLATSSEFAGRRFYAWCGDLYIDPPGLHFSRRLTALGQAFSWEKYAAEQPTEEQARRMLTTDVRRQLAKWQQVMPGVERHMVMCLGYLCAPPETLNLNPAVDYHVFMDMQMHLLATDPVFWGLFGVMQYSSSYADEESLRWAHRLFRHYCIEGRRDPFTADPYALPHLTNPDFAQGLDGWRVDAAGAQTVASAEMEGFSWLQGRYPQTPQGDQFCRMIRSANAPNRVRQTIRALTPGRLYSLKVISADLGALDVAQEHTLSVSIQGVERIEPLSFQFVYPSCYSHEWGEYNRNHPAHFTLHRVVFRAVAPEAELTLSDWASESDPGGPEGQELAFNFVEVQPYR